MYPLNDDVIAGVKIAQEIRMLFVVFVCFSIQGNFAAEKCIICKKMLKGKQMYIVTLYIVLILKHAMKSVIHSVEKYVERAGKP